MAVSLEHTPTWAAATIFFFTISISYILKCSIDFTGTWLRRRQKISLYDAIDKLKEELMILGLLSLILAVVQRPISYFCIPTKAADFMLPCSKVHDNKTSSSSSGHCAAKGMASLVSQQGIHQLHIFIFVLAVVHVLCGVVTMVLGRAKMRRWKAWEKETATTAYQVANDPMRFRFTRETSFARRHINLWTTTSVYMWARCFFRQFYDSVDKVDFLTLRNGFILAHFSRHKTFNFQKYIKRTLDDDFKTVIRISPFMWFLMVIFMLIDIHRWYSYFWLSFLPLVIVLSVGTKLHMIIMKMALQLDKQGTVIGAPPVQPNDDLFWFGNPRFVLFLLHLTFFQPTAILDLLRNTENAFELTFFIWIWYEFGLKSCYHENLGITIARVTIAVVVQFISSYITLPMYALVSQMGSDIKRSLLEDRTRKVLRRWHEDVRRKRKKQHTYRSTASFHTQDGRISMRTTA